MSSAEPRRGPLAGVRIVEIAGIGPLPFAGMLMADMGAEILRIETPRKRELVYATDDPLLRGRATITLDLKEEAGRDAFLGLLDKADILIEGLRPGAMERLGLGPNTCMSRVPHLVYGRSTGWGQTGPLAASAGHDPNYVAYTGALEWLGLGGTPKMPPFALVGDTAGGATYLVMGVLAALLHARQTGMGQVVDGAIIDGTLSLMTPIFAMMQRRQKPAALWQPMNDGSCPYARLYETRDGLFMVVCALEPRFYAAFVEGLGLDLVSLPDRTDEANWPALRETFAARIRQQPRCHWVDQFAVSDACIAPVISIQEAPDHPVNQARNAFIDGLPAPAPRFSGTPTFPASTSHNPQPLIDRWSRPS
ncbi:MAG TPA: CaiB/BaiF CoA-transferase family protein [Sphingobium sp.]|nr:CaiB/BaiF CoA-transferase family protein [Sphingobium sp.]